MWKWKKMYFLQWRLSVKRRSIKNRKQDEDDDGSLKSDKVRKRKSIVDYVAQQENILKTRENLLNEKNTESKNAEMETHYSNRRLRPKEKR